MVRNRAVLVVLHELLLEMLAMFVIILDYWGCVE